ncbi:MAG: type II secretion system protein [Pseudomonadota bacterium]
MIRANKGFTLIELVVVISILGILAAFAIPRFVSLEVEARVAATESLEGSVRSAAALAHALWLAQQSPATINMEGAVITMVNGYPATADIRQTLQDDSGYGFAAGPPAVWTRDGAATPANCSVSYTQPAAPGAAPQIVGDVAGC